MTGNVVKIARTAKAKELKEQVWVCISRDERGLYHAPTIHYTEAEAQRIGQELLARGLRVFVASISVPA